MQENSQPTILITGCTRGLGRAMVDAFTARGARVIGCARSQQHISELNQTCGESGRFYAVDICDDEALVSLATEVLEQFGAPDFLINNAALINHNAPLREVPAREFSDVIDVNIKGTANMQLFFQLPSLDYS